MHDRRAGVGDADVAGVGRAVVGELLGEDDLLHERHLLAAVLLRPGGRHPALCAELEGELLGEVPVLVEELEGVVVPVGRQLGGQELADLLAEGLFFGAKAIVHGASPSAALCGRYSARSYYNERGATDGHRFSQMGWVGSKPIKISVHLCPSVVEQAPVG